MFVAYDNLRSMQTMPFENNGKIERERARGLSIEAEFHPALLVCPCKKFITISVKLSIKLHNIVPMTHKANRNESEIESEFLLCQ
jgi:hypothetical protein